ncbi:MAG: peptide chain release factor N(5)-glutamine methyltransferase [Ilumatobacteraceae bacterium]
MDGTISWRELWDETARTHGRVHARWLCEEASGAFGDEFDEVLTWGATERAVAHLDAMLARLRAGEPLQYVLGHWSFRRLDLLVDRRVLIPRPETELVAEVALAEARAAIESFGRPLLAADLGTGSGALGLSLLGELPRGAVEVWLTDVSLDALDVARANAAGLGMAGAGARFGSGSWFAALPDDLRGSLGLVVSNPPYIAEGDPAVDASVHGWEPHGALYAGADGLDAVREIAVGAAEWLRPGGALVLEIGTGQGRSVIDVLRSAGLVDATVRPDLAGHDRIALARRT